MRVDLTDDFWAPRLAQLCDSTLGVMLERLERQGVVDNFRRLTTLPNLPHRAMHFADSDLFKWLEAAVLVGEVDRYDEVVALVEAVQAPDGYVGTYYGHDDHPARYSDLTFGHEHYCMGHLIEAAVSHHHVTGSDRLLNVAIRTADHLLATFGPGRDQRTDAHPEIELALCRLATATGDGRYVEHAAWAIEQQLSAAGTSLESFELGGHAVRALYLTSGIAEVALATGDPRWQDAARRTYDVVLDRHSYPTGAVGGRWLGEATGRPFEQPDATAYAESCAAVAAAQLAWRMWRLTADPRPLDHLELLLFNAVPCGVGADGASWFYSQPHAVAEVAPDHNLWTYEFDYGQAMLREWFPARRHRWFAVPCCPPNLARAFASVPQWIAEPRGADLLVHLPLAGRVHGDGWDVTITGGYPSDGRIAVTVDARPAGGRVLVRRPAWAGGAGHEAVPADGGVDLPVDWTWWTTDHRVEGGITAHVRRGPVVHCVEGIDHPGLDVRDLAVDPTTPPPAGFVRWTTAGSLHRPWTPGDHSRHQPAAVSLRPYADWANRETTTLAVRFPVV